MTEPYARLTELIDHHAKVIKEINWNVLGSVNVGEVLIHGSNLFFQSDMLCNFSFFCCSWMYNETHSSVK